MPLHGEASPLHRRSVFVLSPFSIGVSGASSFSADPSQTLCMIRCILLQNRAGKVRSEGGRRRGNGSFDCFLSFFFVFFFFFFVFQPLPLRKKSKTQKNPDPPRQVLRPARRLLQARPGVRRAQADCRERDSKLSNVVEVRRKIRRKRERENDDEETKEKLTTSSSSRLPKKA